MLGNLGVRAQRVPHTKDSLAYRIEVSNGRAVSLLHFYPEVLAVDIAARCRRAFKGDLILGRDLPAVRI